MKESGGKIVVRALEEEGVRLVLGIPGTHNIELWDALLDARDMQLVLVSDEQCASFMADGAARSGGGLACLNIVPSAGLTNAMSGIAEAYLDQVPMLVLACGIRRDTGAAYQLHDVDQGAMARPVCKDVLLPLTHAELSIAIHRACRLARVSPPGPVMVEVPANLYLSAGEVAEAYDEPKLPYSPLDADKVRAIAKALSAARSVGIYVGLGAVGARDLLLELAERLDAVVFTTVSGKGVFPETHARFAWCVLGAAAPKPIRAIAEQFDCLLAIGCRFAEVATASYGFTPPANLIHIDIDETVFNRNVQAAYTLTADARAAVTALLAEPSLARKTQQLAKLKALRAAHEAVLAEQSAHVDKARANTRVSPVSLMRELQRVFGEETVFVTDSGNGTFLGMEILKLPRAHSFLGPIDYSCMGYSVPAAIGAKLASPHRPVVALAGDGAFLMTGMELVTAATYGVGVVICILHDGELSQIAQFQRRSLNRVSCTRLGAIDFQGFSQALGLEFVSIANQDAVAVGLMRAKELSEQGRPVLVDVAIDYSLETYFTKGVLKSNFLRFGWQDRLRLIGRVIGRKTGVLSS